MTVAGARGAANAQEGATAPNGTSSPAEPTGLAGLAFTAICVYTFLLYSRAVEFIDSHGTMHLMMLIAIPAILLVGLSGRMLAGLQSRIGVYLVWFTACAALSIPFSIWKGGSFYAFISGWPKSFIVFLLITGVIVSIRQLRQFGLIVALGEAALLLITNLHSYTASDDRMSVQWGTLGNANDLATIILIGLPFCLYVAADTRRAMPLRLAFLAVSAGCVVTVLKTGSRSGFLAIGLVGLLVFLRAPAIFKVVIAGGAIVMVAALPFVLTPELKARYMTIFSVGDLDEALRSSDNKVAASALESAEDRRALLESSLHLSLTHPVFGVGYAVFPAANAGLASSRGETPDWHEVHNVFAVVLVENGIPALFFYGSALYLSLRAAARSFRRARQDPAQAELARFSVYLLISLAFYVICSNFATDAYGFQLPLLSGMAAALDIMARNMANTSPSAPPSPTLRAGVLRPRPRPLPAPLVNSAG